MHSPRMHSPRMHGTRTRPLAVLAVLSVLAPPVVAQGGGLKWLWERTKAAARYLEGAEQGTALVAGRVVDPAGAGIAGVSVALGSAETLDSGAALRAPLARTDARGEFSFVLQAPEGEEGKRRGFLLAVGQERVAVRVAMPQLGYRSHGAWRAPGDARQRLGQAGLDLLARVRGRAARFVPADARVPEIVLRPGRRLRGRVVDGGGQPVAGARVSASDLLSQSRFQGLTDKSSSQTYLSCATTAEDGTFDLPGVLPTGSLLRIEKEGYFQVERTAVAAEPLTVTLRRGGSVRGKVVGKDGKPAQAALEVKYEVAAKGQTVKVGSDGAFEFQLQHPHRFRLRFQPSGSSSKEYDTTFSPIYEAARQDLVVTLDPKKAAAKAAAKKAAPKPMGGEYGFVVSVVDRDSGRPLADFKAASVWVSSYYAENDPYLRSRASSQAKKSDQPGYIRVLGPTSTSAQSGGVVVIAKGYATRVLRVDWTDGRPRHLEAAMVPESIIAGVVRDGTTGAPVQGASVRLYAYTDDRRRSQSTSATSGKDGAYRFDGLPAGYYRVTVSHKNRGADSHTLDLRAEEKRGDVDFGLRPQSSVRGRITGLQIGDGWQVELLTESRVRALLQNPGYRPSGSRVPLRRDGRFVFEAVQPGFYEVCVRIPQDPRRGGGLLIPLEPIRVRERACEREIDASADRPGTIRGTVSVRGVEIDPSRLLVVAVVPSSRSPWSYAYRQNIDISGSRCQVREDGGFDLEVCQGEYVLTVIDVVTGVTVLDTTMPVDVDSPGEVRRDLEVVLTRARVRLKPKQEGGSIAASWLDVDVEPPQAAMFAGVIFGSSDNRKPSGCSLVGREGEVIELVLPPYKTMFRVHSDVGQLARTKEKPRQILGDHEFTPKVGEVNEVEIEVDVPREGFDPDPAKEAEAEAKGKRQQKRGFR